MDFTRSRTGRGLRETHPLLAGELIDHSQYPSNRRGTPTKKNLDIRDLTTEEELDLEEPHEEPTTSGPVEPGGSEPG